MHWVGCLNVVLVFLFYFLVRFIAYKWKHKAQCGQKKKTRRKSNIQPIPDKSKWISWSCSMFSCLIYTKLDSGYVISYVIYIVVSVQPCTPRIKSNNQCCIYAFHVCFSVTVNWTSRSLMTTFRHILVQVPFFLPSICSHLNRKENTISSIGRKTPLKVRKIYEQKLNNTRALY